MLKELFEPKRILFYIILSCVSFTVCDLLLSIINMLENWYENSFHYYNLQYFAVCVGVSVLMFFTDKLSEDFNILLKLGIQITDVTISTFGLGGFVFGWFPLDLYGLVIAFGILLLIYFGTLAIMYFVNKRWIDDVNQIIIKKRKEKNNDTKDY